MEGIRPKTQFEALRHFGYINRIDFIITGTIGVATAVNVILLAKNVISLHQFWIGNVSLVNLMLTLAVMTIYRLNYFVIQAHAIVKTMPDKAAALASDVTSLSVSDDKLPSISVSFDVLKSILWVQRIDYIAAGLAFLGTVGGLCLYARPEVGIKFVVSGTAAMSVWVAILGFRGIWFALQMMADLRDIPQAAARLLLLFSTRA